MTDPGPPPEEGAGPEVPPDTGGGRSDLGAPHGSVEQGADLTGFSTWPAAAQPTVPGEMVPPRDEELGEVIDLRPGAVRNGGPPTAATAPATAGPAAAAASAAAPTVPPLGAVGPVPAAPQPPPFRPGGIGASATTVDPGASGAPSGVSPPPSAAPTTTTPPAAAIPAATDGGSAAAGGVSGPGAHPGGRPARSVLLATLPVLLVLVATVVAIWIPFAASADASRRATELTRSSEHERSVRAATDELWSGVLGVVAGGVGEQVVRSDDVLTLVGAARSTAPRTSGAGSGGDETVRRAQAAHRGFVDAVADAVERSGGAPVELGNELSSLAAAHGRTTEATVELGDALAAEARREEGRAADLRRLALLATIVGALLAAVAAVLARRRLVATLDEPADAIAVAVGSFARGDVTARVGSVGGAGLGELAAHVDDDLGLVADEFDRLHRRAAWGEQSRMILEALDGAESEDAAHDVIRRALALVDPAHHPVELLLADRGSTRLRAVAGDPVVPRPGCPVDSTGACPALRRGQVAVWDSSESINACPKLRDRPAGALSAVCVPVTVATRPVGVLHMTGPDRVPPPAAVTDRLVTLSVQVGNRLGALRTLESTRKEASTDGLTGLPNRRMLESEVATLLERGTPFVMVLADLDKFKKLNDNFGHEIGDKALQLFAGVLRDNVRGNDVVSRLGGEEFVLVYPNMTVEISIEAIGRLRQALARALAASRLPPFTCSFGVTHSDVGGDGDTILRIADAGLLRAKELGGDQAVFADEDLAATIFSNGDPRPASPPPVAPLAAPSASPPVPPPADPDDPSGR